MQPENCVTCWSPEDIKSNVSRDLLKIFGFCRMFWIANSMCDTENKKNHVYLLYGFLLRFKTLMLVSGNRSRQINLMFDNLNANSLTKTLSKF